MRHRVPRTAKDSFRMGFAVWAEGIDSQGSTKDDGHWRGTENIMTEIKPGPELDRAVAEAIGLVCTHRVLCGDMQVFFDPRDPDPLPRLKEFSPSTDMNDAFMALDQSDILTENRVVFRRDITGEKWEIVDVYVGSEPFTCHEIILASEDNPPLAVCAAVLRGVRARKLAEESRERILQAD